MSAVRIPLLLACCLLAACAQGPNFVAPQAAAPDDWSAWTSNDPSLRLAVSTADSLPADWWRLYGDPVLDDLEQRAFAASPDLLTAGLHLAEARVQRRVTDAQRGPTVDASAAATRQRQSENAAGSRVLRAIAGDKAQPFIDLVSQPFTLYQAGFDFSWELDLWGRVGRSVEAADADVQRQAALLAWAHLSLASDVAQNYFELRTVQRQLRLMREDIAAMEQRLGLLQARVQAGVVDHLDLDRQGTELAALRAQLPPLLAQEGASANRVALLLGEHPGALRTQLQPRAEDPPLAIPDLAAGLPSELARRRPDIRAAEAQLHATTASIGVAQAELYPSIRIGASFGYQSYIPGAFTEWGSRNWSIGPSLDLPLFDQGRRRSTVQLRELQQQEAAVAWQKTVLQAWQEIDDALGAYAAERLQAQALEARSRSARDLWELVQARYQGGTVDYSTVIDAERGWLQARRDLAASQGRLGQRFAAVNKAIGNVPREEGAASGAVPQ
jgi:NodT family efflux transporter outer membrane factor (OMF) lipoprotein